MHTHMIKSKKTKSLIIKSRKYAETIEMLMLKDAHKTC